MTAAEHIKKNVFKTVLAELADARDLKSRSRKGVRVRPPLPAVKELLHIYAAAFFDVEEYTCNVIEYTESISS